VAGAVRLSMAGFGAVGFGKVRQVWFGLVGFGRVR
jgi:hypothetical protein